MDKKKKDNGGSTSRKMNQGQLVSFLIVFVIGFVAGVGFTVYKRGSLGLHESPSTAASGTGKQDEMENAIINLEARVTARPDDFQAWVQLGHLYYDTNQPNKAIGAYQKSLELHSGDANLLTDLGTMYRRTKQPEKALAAYDKAIAMNPEHLQSRFNKGVVLLYDLNDPQGAIASWEEVIRRKPDATTSDGQPLREFIGQIKNNMTSP